MTSVSWPADGVLWKAESSQLRATVETIVPFLRLTMAMATQGATRTVTAFLVEVLGTVLTSVRGRAAAGGVVGGTATALRAGWTPLRLGSLWEWDPTGRVAIIIGAKHV